MLHHVNDAQAAIAYMVASRRRASFDRTGFLPVSVAEPSELRAFWDGWLAWSRERGIDYQIERSLAARLAPRCLTNIRGTAETAV